MTSQRRVGSRAPLTGVIVATIALLLLSTAAAGRDPSWSALRRVSEVGGSRLDSLHQLAADRGLLHLVHPRIGPNRTDDRISYQRSENGGFKWTAEKTIFTSSSKDRHVVPNLAIDAKRGVVAVAFRVNGPEQNTLFVRVSRDDGDTFGVRQEIFSTAYRAGIGVPAVAVGNGFVAVGYTDRSNGKVKVRVSRDDGRTFGKTRILGRSRLSIDCRRPLRDALVGMAAADKVLHVAWSHAPKRSCQAASIKVRTARDRGSRWSKTRTVTRRRSYGWPELEARQRTVVATVQSPDGGLIVARSGQNGRRWRDRLIRAPRGYSFSAGDITLLPDKKAMLTYVSERVKRNRLLNTTVVTRRSPDDGVSWRGAKTVADTAKRLRMAPNIASNSKKVTIVLQAGPLDGSPRNVFSTRLR